MARKWSVRLLALGALTAALGCHSAPAPSVATPLLPEMVVPGPPPVPLAANPIPFPAAVAAVKDNAPFLPSGAHLPGHTDLVPPALPGSNIAGLSNTPPTRLGPSIAGPEVPALVSPPKDVAPILTSQPKLIDRPKPAVKPPLVEQLQPPVGPDALTPPPIVVPPPSPDETRSSPTTVKKVSMSSGQPDGRFGHAADYKWMTGVLDRYAKGGYWTLRYADYSTNDEWGGKVRLVDDPRLDNFKDGDQIFVEGELLAPRAAASADGTSYPPYRINSVRLVPNVK